MGKPTNEILKDKTLLVLSWFPDAWFSYENGDITCMFIKDQVEVLKRYFKKIIVIDPVPYFPSFLFGFLPGYMKKQLSKKDYRYDNVEVYYPRFIRFPRRGKTVSSLEEQRFMAADWVIRENEIEFDLIHAHFTFPGGYIGRRIKNKYKKPLVTTVHENYQWFREELDSKDKELDRIWKESDILWSINKKDVYELKQKNDNCWILQNGYSSLRFRPVNDAKSILGLPKDRKLILAVGDLVKKKGHVDLIEAMKKVSENSDANCVILGEGPLKKKLEKAIHDLGLESRVSIEGRKSNVELNLWMNACDLFVLPSLSESFGLVQVEAMSCGKPVVATRNGGSEYILYGSYAGLLVEKEDPQQLSRAILEALDKKWDHEAIRKYTRFFDIEIVTHSVLEGYGNLLRERA